MALIITFDLLPDDYKTVIDLSDGLPGSEYELVAGIDAYEIASISVSSVAMALQLITLIVQIRQDKKDKLKLSELIIDKDGEHTKIKALNLPENALIELIKNIDPD